MSILKNPIQVLFLIFGILSVILVFPFTYFCYSYIQKVHESKKGNYELPDWRDFKWTLLSIAIISICDVLAFMVLSRLFRPFVKIQDDLEERDRRSEKAGYNLFKLGYYVAVTAWGYVILKDKQFFPVLLGGSGDINRCFEKYPFQPAATREGVWIYIVFQLGFHV